MPIIAYLQGGPADLQKHVLAKELRRLFIAYVQPDSLESGNPASTFEPRRCEYHPVGSYGAANGDSIVTYAYAGDISTVLLR